MKQKPMRKKQPLKQTTVLKPTTKKRAKPKVRTIPKLKKDLDKVFKRYVKYRDGYMDNGEWKVPCITCPKITIYRGVNGERFTDCQGGHFMVSVYGATQFHEQNVHGQCYRCNYMLSGAPFEYAEALDKKYGPGTADNLRKLAHTPDFHFNRDDLIEKIKYYTEAIAKYEAMW